MKRSVILGFLRHALTTGGGALATRGLLESADVEVAVGAVVTLIGIIWSAIEKHRSGGGPSSGGGAVGAVASVLLLCAVVPALVLTTGCASNLRGTPRIVAAKHTVLGLDMSTDPTTQIPHIRLGLVRWFSQEVPVSTNEMHAPEYVSSTAADITVSRQRVNEEFGTGAGGVRTLEAPNVLTPARAAPPVIIEGPER